MLPWLLEEFAENFFSDIAPLCNYSDVTIALSICLLLGNKYEIEKDCFLP